MQYCNMLNVFNRKMINAIDLNSDCNLKEKANADIKLLHSHFTRKICETNTIYFFRKENKHKHLITETLIYFQFKLQVTENTHTA